MLSIRKTPLRPAAQSQRSLVDEVGSLSGAQCSIYQRINQAGDIPDNQVFVEFAFSAGPYRVRVPEGWARTDAPGTTTFTDNFNSVRLDATASATAPTVQSASDDEVPGIESSSTNFQLINVTTTTRKAGLPRMASETAARSGALAGTGIEE